MRATFLLGSGISIPAGLPKVGDLTQAVVSGEGFRLLSEGVWRKADTEQSTQLLADAGSRKLHKILRLLNWLKEQAAARYRDEPERTPNYEDLAYLAGQIYDDYYGNFENPAIQPFVGNALIDLGELWRNSPPDRQRQSLGELAGSAVDYIRQVVARKLQASPISGEYLRLFKDASLDVDVSELNLFTLNHDLLVESSFAREEIAVGLKEFSDGSRRWDATVFDAPGVKARLFKLHGSVNWHRWGLRSVQDSRHPVIGRDDRYSHFVGSYSALDSMHPLYEFAGSSEGPLILAGTFNKMLDYTKGIFLELQHRFLTALAGTDTLVICGYGFGDKGINTRIVEWRHQSPQNQLLIIDPAPPSEILKRARGAIRREISAIDSRNAKNSLPSGLVHHWPNGLEELLPSNGMPIVTWERIREVIRNRIAPA